jgi:hypothetical protein
LPLCIVFVADYIKDMGKRYSANCLLIMGVFFMLMASCKKDPKTPTPVKPASLATLGLYELVNGTNRRVFIPITQVGTQKVTYYSVFDTGSPGMTLDANGLIPASMITSSGITVAGDSVNVNGITITTQQAVITYGDNGGQTQEFGNLAYAPITIGDQNGNITTTRIPFFLYYKIVDVTTGKQLPAHASDVFGVGPGVSFTNSHIGSPLSYFKMPAGVTSGFKLAMLNESLFSTSGTYAPALLTIGLVPDDFSSGFIMHGLNYFAQGGYSPDLPATITYNGVTVNATVLFDTGTPSVSTIENSSAGSNSVNLPANTNVAITTRGGFSYQYTTTPTRNLTQVDNPSFSGDPRTIFSIDFFLKNEYLLDYTNHRIGLKNN